MRSLVFGQHVIARHLVVGHRGTSRVQVLAIFNRKGRRIGYLQDYGHDARTSCVVPSIDRACWDTACSSEERRAPLLATAKTCWFGVAPAGQ